jgi:WD40 repeat protein
LNIFRITGNVSKSLNTFIFSLVVLSDSTIVSGDNRGHLQIWDGNTGTLIITFDQNTADIRCIAVNSHENKIFASGTDSRVICIKRINDGSSIRSFVHFILEPFYKIVSTTISNEKAELLPIIKKLGLLLHKKDY